MHTPSPRLLILLLLASLLAGCGFQLRSSDALMAHAPLYIAGLARYDTLRQSLEDTLTASHVALVPSKEMAKSIMKIRDQGERQQIITVDSRGKATEYMLIRTVGVSLVTPDGSVLVPEHTVSVRRTWTEAGKTGLAGSREARELRLRMLRELSMSILRALDYALR
ncbi:MAG: LPS assembly lipoprotein LptE [Gammaproteobacteria bacterium]|jgi:LPS-assembly lipoprotein